MNLFQKGGEALNFASHVSYIQYICFITKLLIQLYIDCIISKPMVFTAIEMWHTAESGATLIYINYETEGKTTQP